MFLKNFNNFRGIFVSIFDVEIKRKQRRLKKAEALIGILYAFGISIVFIIMSKSLYGLEELNRLLAYDILFVNYSQVFKIFILYSILGIVLFLGLKYLNNFLKDLFNIRIITTRKKI